MPDDKPDNHLESSGRKRSGETGDVPEAIRRRYYTDELGGLGLGFFVDATVERPAFIDHGGQLRTLKDDPNVIRDLLEISRHRGWDIVAVRGSSAFRREAWIVAQEVGIEVRGYEPTQRDMQDLERRAVRRHDHERAERAARPQLRVVDAVVRDRLRDEEARSRVMAAARERVAHWLERGATFDLGRPRRSPDHQHERAK